MFKRKKGAGQSAFLPNFGLSFSPFWKAQDPPGEKRIVLPDVTWQQYMTLLDEMGVQRTTRLTYLRHKLEMMNPMPEHERCRKLIDSLLLVLGDELRSPITAIAPVLLLSPDYHFGAEPDACYYVQTQPPAGVPTKPDELAEGGRPAELHLPPDPVPDILVEVAITKSLLNKFPAYAQLGIPEIWYYFTKQGEDVLKGDLFIYQLRGQEYIEADRSAVFPCLPAERVLLFLEHSDSMGLPKSLVVLREWIQRHC